MGFGSSKTMLYMNILTYIDVLVNIKASALIYIDKGVFFFDLLINAPYSIQLKKGPFPIKACPRPDRGKDPLNYLYTNYYL